MFTIVVVLHVIVCLVLIVVILLQAGRGAGLANIFGGGGGVQTLFGTSAATFLTRATTVCAILFLLTCLSLGIISYQRGRSLMEEEVLIEEPVPQPAQEKTPLQSETTPEEPAPLESSK